MSTAILGLGSNIGDRLENLQKAVDAIRLLPKTRVTAISSVYRTAPWGYTEQEDFYNLCVSVQTELSPQALLGGCFGIEAAAGRQRPFPNSPRILDIDLLLYENVSCDTKELTLPHREIKNRAFVLAPLGEVISDSVFSLDTQALLLKLKDQRIEKLTCPVR